MSDAVTLAPVRGRARIEVIDILRGFAILGIFFINIPFMAGPTWAALDDPRTMGWSGADQFVWLWQTALFEGTQRGLLEFLFGAGLMVTAAKAMEPDGPVAIADLYIRRNLWLLAFGLLDLFALAWPGDILHIYGLAALALFPFRKLSLRWLIPLGLLFPVLIAGGGIAEFVSRTETQALYQVAKDKPVAAQTTEEREAVKEWKEHEQRIAGKDPTTEKMIKEEAKARTGSLVDYVGFQWKTFMEIIAKGGLIFGVIEAFGTMLLGIALWKLGFIQGQRSTKVYLIVLVLAYGFGVTARYVGGLERMSFMPIPKTIWATAELARLAVSLGHVALINLLFRFAPGKALLKPFVAAGQVAFSLYFLEQIIGIWIMFAPFGMALPGGQGWAHLAVQAGVVTLGLLILANVWTRFFVSGPLEWVWRSLSYYKRQPFRRSKLAESS